MSIIKKYQQFLEELNMKPEIDLFSAQVELYHCGDHIWAIKSPDSHTRALMFMRAQEFYESAFEEIIKQQFKISRFVDLYKQQYGKKEFTYGSDWAGFNIPSTVLEECMFNVPEDEINNWDKLMLDVISKIKEVEKEHNYYLLGVDELSDSLLEHEFAHAMYFTLPEYKTAMDSLTAQCDKVVRDSMFKCITEYGYADHVLPDEIQAYMATGLGKKMIEMNIPNIDEWIAKYREVFESFYSKTLYSSPEKIDLKWS
jgi:hypothetical protein